MNHQPFETWLLENPPLLPEQVRDLQAHLRACTGCAALAEVHAALRATRQVRPPDNFVNRFALKLALRKQQQRRRAFWGGMIILVGSLGLLLWFGTPLLVAFFDSPVEFFIVWASALVTLFTSLHTFGAVSSVLLEVFSGLVPFFFWMIVASALSGLGLLWGFTFWRSSQLTRKPV